MLNATWSSYTVDLWCYISPSWRVTVLSLFSNHVYSLLNPEVVEVKALLLLAYQRGPTINMAVPALTVSTDCTWYLQINNQCPCSFYLFGPHFYKLASAVSEDRTLAKTLKITANHSSNKPWFATLLWIMLFHCSLMLNLIPWLVSSGGTPHCN